MDFRSSAVLCTFGFATVFIGSLAVTSCTTREPVDSTYFERTIAPLLTTSCVRTSTGAGCHVATEKGNAFGNLDVSSFDGINHRRDLLADYGPYGQSALLLKSIEPVTVEVQSFDGVKVAVKTDIKHAGGSILSPSATGFLTIRRWIENGATENNTGVPPSNVVRLPCNEAIPNDPSFLAWNDPIGPDYQAFKDKVVPVMAGTCAAGNCHGTLANELYLTCGNNSDQVRWNYYVATQYLAQTPELSELARKPLSPSQGGSYHEGGTVFPTPSDPGYQAIVSWAKEYGPAHPSDLTPDLLFFAHRVQPLLVKKGCMMLQCHSSAQFHDYRLRGGSGGSFSLHATRQNYELSLAQLSLESENLDASRLVQKNLFRPEVFVGGHGLAHRGGPLLEDFAGKTPTPADCDATIDYETADLNDEKVKPYCVINEWHRRERATRGLTPFSGIVYVKRTSLAGVGRVQDFDTFSGGSELHIAKATITTAGDVTLGADTNVTTNCGLTSAADIRRPAVSWDAKQIAFAARASASEPFQIYEMNSDGTNCVKHADINAGQTTQNGILVHNFDPAYSPYDTTTQQQLVFASTRGNLVGDAYDYAGPQRTPSDPSKPNANLYVYAQGKPIRQLTYLLNTEREPSFMSDGRLIFTAEKRAKDFYQLALRRINLDGADYHPLFAQRGSIGFHEATHVVETSDKNFAAIFSDPGLPQGGGTLGVFNRSIGIDFGSANPADYPLDPTVTDPASPSSPESNFFLHSLRFPDPTVSGHAKQPTTGLYTTPSPLPEGKLLVSFGAAATTDAFGGDYDIYVMDPITGAKTKLLGDAGSAEVDAVAIYGRPLHRAFASRVDEPNANTSILPSKTEANIHILDTPVLGSLLFQNTPTGRLVEEDLGSFDLYEDMPPAAGITNYAGGGANVVTDAFGQVYVRRRLLGHVPVASDGSTRFLVPGGLPIQIKLPDSTESLAKSLPRLQRESIVFAPGEASTQSFRREFFNGLCANCHGSISGRPLDIAVRPDMLTQASATLSRTAQPYDLNVAPNKRGPVEGP